MPSNSGVPYCFVAMPWGDPIADQVLNDAIRPVLKKIGWDLLDPLEVESGAKIFDLVVKWIRACDFFIADVTTANANVMYELGLAHAWGKKSLLLTRSLDTGVFDLMFKYPVIVYASDLSGLKKLQANLGRRIEEFKCEPNKLSDPTLERFLIPQATLSFEIFSKSMDPKDVFGFVSRTLEVFGQIVHLQELSIKEIRVGSFGAWISSNIPSVAEVARKILFFIPEWRLINAKRIKIEAEAEVLRANARKFDAESEEIRRRSNRKDARLLFEVLESKSDGGTFRITIGDMIMLEKNEDGIINIGSPK